MLPFHQQNGTDFNAFVSTMYECTNKSTGQIIDSSQCICDIGIGGWFQNPSRFGKVSYLPPFGYDRYVVFTHVSQATVAGNVWFFVSTFDARAWICIAALFVMFTFLKMLDRRFEADAEYSPLPPNAGRVQCYLHYITKSRPVYRLRKAAQSTISRMLLLSDEQVISSTITSRQWFLNIILAGSALFLALSYEASMTASLVHESIQTRFQSAMDFVQCRIDPSEMCLIRGGALETYWKKSIATSKCHFRNPPHYFTSYDVLFEAVKNGACKYAIGGESTIMSAIQQKYCGSLVIVGEAIRDGSLSMLLPIGSNLTEPMSVATLELSETQTEPALRKYLNTLPKCEVDVNSALTFEKLRLFFVIAFSIGVIELLAMVLIPQYSSTDNNRTGVLGTNEDQSKQRKPSRAGSESSEDAK
eukprot:TRINITY_DN971_c0_g1_i3.p1 TRINITY_DN971_c0_g1~~TRINITY_DN971_c0_g1_i3.p1  ORF type:complete len:416 (+),score=44.43 TRINITY_DN971_c0_g1_i3:414-1661(+)